MIFFNDKPYNSLNYYLRNKFGEKVYKISLDGGFTCPNRDGVISTKGCIFCSEGGSGEFASNRKLSIKKQIDEGIKLINKKFKGNKYIAYFQAYTNTYAPIEYLKNIFYQAINDDRIVGLAIATRPDCINEDIALLLKELNEIKPLWIELGLQTIHESSAYYIRRGYTLKIFEKCVSLLQFYHIDIVVHIILGIPGETYYDMLETVKYIALSNIQGIKFHLLHVLKNTDLAKDYQAKMFKTLTRDQYIKLIVDCIEILPKNIVIHRLTGDGPRKLLIAPSWSTDKKGVLNGIIKEFKLRNSWQSKKYKDIS